MEDSMEVFVGARQKEFDAYLWEEQSALVEAEIRAYSRRPLKKVLEQFEVLEVEREGEWTLAEWTPKRIHVIKESMFAPDIVDEGEPQELVFQSRPDALLLERDSRQLYLLSFKTTAGWDTRKARSAEHDMQGLTEGIEIERRLATLWDNIQKGNSIVSTPRMVEYVQSCPAPPRILAIRYEYLLKGSRWVDKDLTARFGFECRSQRSHLVRCYKGQGKSAAQGLNWAWDYMKDDGSISKLSWQNWKSTPVWEQMSIREWIDKLDDTAVVMSGEDATVGMAPRELGYQSAAQSTGYTATHPLDEVFLPPIVIFRQEDELRDLIDSLEYQERQIVEHLAEIEAATDEGEKRHLLNIYFPMHRAASFYPSQCEFVPICYGGDVIKTDPIGSGLYQIRTLNHPVGGE